MLYASPFYFHLTCCSFVEMTFSLWRSFCVFCCFKKPSWNLSLLHGYHRHPLQLHENWKGVKREAGGGGGGGVGGEGGEKEEKEEEEGGRRVARGRWWEHWEDLEVQTLARLVAPGSRWGWRSIWAPWTATIGFSNFGHNHPLHCMHCVYVFRIWFCISGS